MCAGNSSNRFGDANNPFPGQNGERLLCDPNEALGSKIITYLTRVDANPDCTANPIKTEVEGEVEYRHTGFESHAPYYPKGNIFINHAYLHRPPEKDMDLRHEVRINVGDSSTQHGSVHARWIQLTSPDSKPFAMSGERTPSDFNREGPWLEFNALTLVLRQNPAFNSGIIEQQVWGTFMDEDGYGQSSVIGEPGEHGYLVDSLKRSLNNAINRLPDTQNE